MNRFEGGVAPAGRQHAGHTPAQHTASTAPVATKPATVQETCPVMGGPINPDIFVEYKGQKVYFCCKGCDQKFREDPEKYIAKLPQFQESPQEPQAGASDTGHKH